MAEYSQEEIDLLISCSKLVSSPPKRKSKLVGADFRNDMTLAASNQETTGQFYVFMRQNEDFSENFSIGLAYQPRDGRQEITLVRCNRKHGIYNSLKNADPDHPHWDFHIHRADASLLESGQKPEKIAAKTDAYASYEEALPFFLRLINLDAAEIQRYFPDVKQDQLFG